MNHKIRIIIFCLLILLGVGLLTYGAFFHFADVSPQQESDSTVVAKSEPALIQEVTVGGVKRDESGTIKQTYTGEAPKACPT
jgi:hypothetical protein